MKTKTPLDEKQIASLKRCYKSIQDIYLSYKTYDDIRHGGNIAILLKGILSSIESILSYCGLKP